MRPVYLFQMIIFYRLSTIHGHMLRIYLLSIRCTLMPPPIHHFFIMISHRICIDRKTDQIRIRNFCYLRAPICIPAPV